jgi:hypothetical protein
MHCAETKRERLNLIYSVCPIARLAMKVGHRDHDDCFFINSVDQGSRENERKDTGGFPIQFLLTPEDTS